MSILGKITITAVVLLIAGLFLGMAAIGSESLDSSFERKLWNIFSTLCSVLVCMSMIAIIAMIIIAIWTT